MLLNDKKMNLGIDKIRKQQVEKPLTLSDCIAAEIGYRTACESLTASIADMDSYFEFMNNICELEKVARKYNSTEAMQVIDAIVDGRRVRISVENFITEFFKKAKDFFIMIFNKIKDFFVMLARKFKEFLIRKKSLKELADKDDRTINITVKLMHTAADNSVLGYITDTIDKIKEVSEKYVSVKPDSGNGIGARLDQVIAGMDADKISKGTVANKANIGKYIYREDVNIAKVSDASVEYDKLCEKTRDILGFQKEVENCKGYVDKVFAKLDTKEPEVMKESKQVVNALHVACATMFSILTGWTNEINACQADLIKATKEAYVKSSGSKNANASDTKTDIWSSGVGKILKRNLDTDNPDLIAIRAALIAQVDNDGIKGTALALTYADRTNEELKQKGKELYQPDNERFKFPENKDEWTTDLLDRIRGSMHVNFSREKIVFAERVIKHISSNKGNKANDKSPSSKKDTENVKKRTN